MHVITSRPCPPWAVPRRRCASNGARSLWYPHNGYCCGTGDVVSLLWYYWCGSRVRHVYVSAFRSRREIAPSTVVVSLLYTLDHRVLTGAVLAVNYLEILAEIARRWHRFKLAIWAYIAGIGCFADLSRFIYIVNEKYIIN